MIGMYRSSSAYLASVLAIGAVACGPRGNPKGDATLDAEVEDGGGDANIKADGASDTGATGDATPVDAGPLADDCYLGPEDAYVTVTSPILGGTLTSLSVTGEATVTSHMASTLAWFVDFEIELLFADGTAVTLLYGLPFAEQLPAVLGETLHATVEAMVFEATQVGTRMTLRDWNANAPGALRAIIWAQDGVFSLGEPELSATYESADCLPADLDGCGPAVSRDLIATLTGSPTSVRITPGTEALLPPYRVGNGLSLLNIWPPTCTHVPDSGYAIGFVLLVP